MTVKNDRGIFGCGEQQMSLYINSVSVTVKSVPIELSRYCLRLSGLDKPQDGFIVIIHEQ